MDLLSEIREKLKGNPSLTLSSGIEAVATHIEVGEKYHYRAKLENDEHMYTDVIYRTNHAFEGILKEAYGIFSEEKADHKTPYEIEEYMLSEDILKGRVVDLLTNYRKNWRNPSTHDYQLFFSEQESYLAIVNVSAFVSILLDQIIEKLVFDNKYYELEKAAILAREAMDDFDKRSPIDKVYKVLYSYTLYYLNNFDEMAGKPRSTINAEMAAFMKSVAPSFKIKNEPRIEAEGSIVTFDFVVTVDDQDVAIETRSPKPRYSHDDSAISQLMGQMREAKVVNGIVYHYPGQKDDIAVATTASTAWPKDLNLREIYSDDPEAFRDHEYEEPVNLVN